MSEEERELLIKLHGILLKFQGTPIFNFRYEGQQSAEMHIQDWGRTNDEWVWSSYLKSNRRTGESARKNYNSYVALQKILRDKEGLISFEQARLGKGRSRGVLIEAYDNQQRRRTWWRIGWVDSFQPEGRGFDSRSSRLVGTLGKSLTHSCLWRFGVKLRHSIRAVSGALLSSSGLEEAL